MLNPQHTIQVTDSHTINHVHSDRYLNNIGTISLGWRQQCVGGLQEAASSLLVSWGGRRRPT